MRRSLVCGFGACGMKNKRNIIILVISLIVVIVGAVVAVMAVGSRGVSEPVEQLTLAQRYLDEQDYEQAVIEFERLIEIDPKNTEAYIGLAKAYNALGKTDKAAEALNKALTAVDEDDVERIIQAIEELSEPAEETAEAAANPAPEVTQPVAEETEEQPAEQMTDVSLDEGDKLQRASHRTVSADGILISDSYIENNGYVVNNYSKKIGENMLLSQRIREINPDGTYGRLIYRSSGSDRLIKYECICSNLFEWLEIKRETNKYIEEYEYEWTADGVLAKSICTRTEKDSGEVRVIEYEYQFVLNDKGLVDQQLIKKDGKKDRGYYYTYNEAGDTLSIVCRDDYGSVETFTYAYNEHGDVTSYYIVSEYEGVTEYTYNDEYSYKYHDNGDVAEESYTSTDSSGNTSYSVVRYNEYGILVYERSTYSNADGFEEIYECVYDDWGNIISSYEHQKYIDDEGGETFEYIAKYENRYTFGDNGLPVSFETWITEAKSTENGEITENTDEPYLSTITECEYRIIER